jgi:hypothetical protein
MGALPDAAVDERRSGALFFTKMPAVAFLADLPARSNARAKHPGLGRANQAAARLFAANTFPFCVVNGSFQFGIRS